MANEKEIKKKDNWLEWLQERIGDGSEAPQKANLKFGRIAWCNSFDKGDQFKILNESTGIVEDVAITRETRCVYNICRMFNDVYTAKMLKGNPTPSVSPYSTNTEDYDEDLSVATNGAVEYWWKTCAKGAQKLRDTTRNASVGGIGFLKIYYDKNKKSSIYDGEIVLEKVNSLHLFANADATEDEEFREVIHRFPKEKSVAEEEFAEQMAKLGITELETRSKNDAHPEIATASKKADDMTSAEVKSTVIQNDIWIKANKKYPKRWVVEKDEDGNAIKDDKGKEKGRWVGGKHVIVIGQHVLIDEDSEEPDMVPFFAYVVNPVEGDLYGLGTTYPIIPIQRDMNKSCSVVMENTDSMGHLKWLFKEGTVENPSAFDDLSGECIEYSGDKEPHQSTANPLPVHITGRFWELLQIAQLVTKLQDLGMGMIPKGGSQMAASTTNELVNSEDVMFAPDVDRMVEFVQKIIRRYLFLAKKYYKEERIVTIIGANKRPEAMAFFAEKLKDDYNVDIKVGAGFSKSDEAIVTQITGLMQTQAFDKAGVDPRVVMEEVLKKTGLVKIKEDTFKDERQAKRFLKFIVENPGGEYPKNKFVNPNAHIKVFTDYTKLPDFDTADPRVRGAIELYIDRMVGMTIGQNGQTPQPGAPGQPGNAPPQAPTSEEMAQADQNQRLATGQPVADNMGQAEGMAPLGV